MTCVDAFDWILDFKLQVIDGIKSRPDEEIYRIRLDFYFIQRHYTVHIHYYTMANQGIRYFSTRGGEDTLTFEEVCTL